MKVNRSAVAALAAVIAIDSWVIVRAGQAQPPGQGPLYLAPLGVRGQAIFPAWEGWGPGKDGTNVLLIGYFNRNKEQELDIPIGPNNRIEPGGPDYGQPTHFLNGRQYGVFAIPVTKDFGNKKLTWTLTANGQPSVVSFWLNPPYFIDFFKHSANGNEPPVIKFSPDGPTTTGPPRGMAQTLTGTVNQPVTLTLWATDNPPTTVFDPNPPQPGAARGRVVGRGADPAAAGADTRSPGADTPGRGADAAGRGVDAAGGRGGGSGRRRGGPPADVVVIWTKHRGPGEVTIADERIALLNKGDAKATMQAATTATFSAPGEYWLRVQVNDNSGDGGSGDQCCWTTAHVKVNVK